MIPGWKSGTPPARVLCAQCGEVGTLQKNGWALVAGRAYCSAECRRRIDKDAMVFREKDMGEGKKFYIGTNPITGETVRAAGRTTATLIARRYGLKPRFD